MKLLPRKRSICFCFLEGFLYKFQTSHEVVFFEGEEDEQYYVVASIGDDPIEEYSLDKQTYLLLAKDHCVYYLPNFIAEYKVQQFNQTKE